MKFINFLKVDFVDNEEVTPAIGVATMQHSLCAEDIKTYTALWGIAPIFMLPTPEHF